jgi:hypothetical protein
MFWQIPLSSVFFFAFAKLFGCFPRSPATHAGTEFDFTASTVQLDPPPYRSQKATLSADHQQLQQQRFQQQYPSSSVVRDAPLSSHGPPPSKSAISSSPWNVLDSDPLLGPTWNNRSQQSTPLQQPDTAGPGIPKPKPKTLDEVEAELRATARSSSPLAAVPPPPRQLHQPPPPPVHGRPLTLEEVEAQLLRNRAQQQPSNSPLPSQTPPQLPRAPPTHVDQPPPAPQGTSLHPRGFQQPVTGAFAPPQPPVQQPQPPLAFNQHVGSTFYPPLPSANSAPMPAPQPFVSSHEQLQGMRYQANQLRQKPGPGTADILRVLEIKIQEQERLEEQRRRKGKKIAEMVCCCLVAS